MKSFLAIAVGIPLMAILAYFMIARAERLELEAKLVPAFVTKFGGEPQILEQDSKHSTLNFIAEAFSGPSAYFIRLSYEDQVYHAYIEKTLDWSISVAQPSEPATDGNHH